MSRVLFLDIDGVVNCKTTQQRSRGFIGIDPYMAFLVGKIVQDTDCKVILSSSWRHFAEGIEEVNNQVTKIHDKTTKYPSKISDGKEWKRGDEIQDYLDTHSDIETYAILDDDSDMLKNQLPNFFKTSWEEGITKEIAKAVTKHLNGTATNNL